MNAAAFQPDKYSNRGRLAERSGVRFIGFEGLELEIAGRWTKGAAEDRGTFLCDAGEQLRDPSLRSG
jgi:hypothetical protein